MGIGAFRAFRVSIQNHINILDEKVVIDERDIPGLMARSGGNGPDANQAACELVKTRSQLEENRMAITELKKLFVKVNKQWTKPKDRVIGYVVWAPPISISASHGYTKDVCIIKLDEKKFSQSFKGNVIDLGAC